MTRMTPEQAEAHILHMSQVRPGIDGEACRIILDELRQSRRDNLQMAARLLENYHASVVEKIKML